MYGGFLLKKKHDKTSNYKKNKKTIFFKNFKIFYSVALLVILSFMCLSGCADFKNDIKKTQNNNNEEENIPISGVGQTDVSTKELNKEINPALISGAFFQFETGITNDVNELKKNETIKNFKILGLDESKTKIFYQYHSYVNPSLNKNEGKVVFKIKEYDFTKDKLGYEKGYVSNNTTENKEKLDNEKKLFDEFVKNNTKLVYETKYNLEKTTDITGEKV